jgi:DNA-binding CsgD family transcriptional regulator
MTNTSKFNKLGQVSLLISLLFFGWDIVDDVFDHISNNTYYSSSEIIHLTFELLALIALLYSLRLVKSYSDSLKVRTIDAEATVAIFKEGTDTLLRKRLAEVKLSKAEKEITICILKGLSPSEIAEVRSTAVGTVKTQTTSIYRKLGVKSRSELLSELIHDVLDLDALQRQIEQES